jgi:hypothetical protein
MISMYDAKGKRELRIRPCAKNSPGNGVLEYWSAADAALFPMERVK